MPAMEQPTPPMQGLPSNRGSSANRPAIWQAGGAASAESEKLPSGRAHPAPAIITYRAKRVPLHIRTRKVVDLAAVVIVLVIASWIAYTYRRPALPPGAVTHQRSNTIKQQVPLVPTELRSAKKGISTPQTASVPMKDVRKAARNTRRRMRVGDDEIDYISEDVTVRHFAPRLAAVPPKQPVAHGAAVAPP